MAMISQLTPIWLIVFFLGCQSNTKRDFKTETFRQGLTQQASPSPIAIDYALSDSCTSQVPYNASQKEKITAFDRLMLSTENSVDLTVRIQKHAFPGVNLDNRYEQVLLSVGSLNKKIRSKKDGFVSESINIATNSQNPACYTATVAAIKQVGRVFRFTATDPVIISDIDGVLSDLSELKVPLTKNEDTPTLAGAAEALRTLSHKYRIIYLSARDDALFNKTRAWLSLKQFPAGPLYVWNWELGNMFGAARNLQGQYKQQFITELKKKFTNIIAGVGNLPHDADAYTAAQIKPIMISTKPGDFKAGVLVVKTWAEVAQNL